MKLKVSWLVTSKSEKNLALHVGDNPKNVFENRASLALKHNLCLENLIYMNQTHSANIHVVRDSSLNMIEDCDGLITNLPNTPLMVMVADCLPVLIWDSKKGVISAVHAGRNGTFQEIAKKSVSRMISEFGCKKEDISVHIGVGINSCCYEVGKEIADICVKNFGKKYIIMRESRYFLDLQSLNLDQLLSVGVKEENIEISEVCSCCSSEYFSYRREQKTGRFAGIIVLDGK